MRKAAQWAKLVEQFHVLKNANPHWAFGDACYCGGGLHLWKAETCPRRSAKKQAARMEALGELIKSHGG